MSNWELAQLNVAQLIAPIDSPTLADFVAELDRINQLADESPGFVWRLQSDTEESSQDVAENTSEASSTDTNHPFSDDLLVNLSVWASTETLHSYVYRTAHADIMKHRKKWFDTLHAAYTVLWWVPAGHRPDPAEAKYKLDYLRSHGPTADAFTFKTAFDSPG